jgi:hypothetical protein
VFDGKGLDHAETYVMAGVAVVLARVAQAGHDPSFFCHPTSPAEKKFNFQHEVTKTQIKSNQDLVKGQYPLCRSLWLSVFGLDVAFLP